ncbi:MAG: NADH-quinone oxidoreductase subunit N, partial [Chloroflexi bacterium]|nr:NADH-quinone oxidoreductase subunit N [Chloroflexota bacterium]
VAATLGLTLMAGAGDLMMVFLALETASISLYVLAGFLRTNRQSTEAGIKYYLFGAFTSGLTLYGLSLLYGFSGTTNMYALADPLGNLMISGAAGQFNVIVALLLILVGFGFKISAVPFHFWTPDVYEGAPTPVTAFVSTASKAASFALLIRFFTVVWPPEAEFYWTLLLAVIAALTMTVGNVLALVQHNIKRMLAYSSVAQAGYALIGVVAMTQSPFGVAAVGFYMFMYVLTNLLAFSVVIAVNNQIGSDEIADYASLGWRSPYMAIALVIALLSLAGIPPAAGFFGKFFLFAAAVDAGFTWLAVVGVLNAIVALYYYLTVIKVMFVDPNDDMSPVPVALSYRTAMFISGAIVLVLGFLATPVFNWALQASTELVARLP